MNKTRRAATVVVGVSGSRASVAALHWAIDEAQRRHAWLRIVRCWSPEQRAPYAPVDGQLTRTWQHEAARRALVTLVRAEFGTEPPAWVTAELAQGMAERNLVDRSAGADLLVLGSASPLTAAGRSIGPVIRACLSRAECPVVVCAADQPAERTGPARAEASASARGPATRRRPPRQVSRSSPLAVVR